MPLHASLTDTDGLHEPKGISTATVNKVYVSDGAGSGDWTHIPTGWSYSQHSGVAQAFNTTDAKLLINGSGALTTIEHLPPQIRGVSTLWSTANSKITPIALGDFYALRVDLPVTARVTANYLTLSLDIGGGATPTTVILPKFESVAKTAPFTISTEITISVLSATTLANGIQFFLKVDAGSLEITNPSITICRLHSGNT